MSLKKRLNNLMQHGLRYYTISALIGITVEDIEDFYNDKASDDIVKKIRALVDKLERMEENINYYGD